MKERPILFGAPMVRALLAGTKSQTRRIITPQPRAISVCGATLDGLWIPRGKVDYRVWPKPCRKIAEACPYGQPGERLWVRETWQAWQRTSYEHDEAQPVGVKDATASKQRDYDGSIRVDAIEYRATSKSAGPWTPSIHMPRWASRITLEVTGVRVRRVQEITDADAEAEGVLTWARESLWPRCEAMRVAKPSRPRFLFQLLWMEINGVESWKADPWVWVVVFRRVEVQR